MGVFLFVGMVFNMCFLDFFRCFQSISDSLFVIRSAVDVHWSETNATKGCLKGCSFGEANTRLQEFVRRLVWWPKTRCRWSLSYFILYFILHWQVLWSICIWGLLATRVARLVWHRISERGAGPSEVRNLQCLILSFFGVAESSSPRFWMVLSVLCTMYLNIIEGYEVTRNNRQSLLISLRYCKQLTSYYWENV